MWGQASRRGVGGFRHASSAAITERRGDAVAKAGSRPARHGSQGAVLPRRGTARLPGSRRSQVVTGHVNSFNGDLFYPLSGPAGERLAGPPGPRHEGAGRARSMPEANECGPSRALAAPAAGDTRWLLSFSEVGGQRRRSRTPRGRGRGQGRGGGRARPVARGHGRARRSRSRREAARLWGRLLREAERLSADARTMDRGGKTSSEWSERPFPEFGSVPRETVANPHTRGVLLPGFSRRRLLPLRGAPARRVPARLSPARAGAGAAQGRRPPRHQDGP